MKRLIVLFYFLITLLPSGILNSAEEPKKKELSEEEVVSQKLTKNIKIEEKGKNLYNLELRNADLKDIIRFFAYQYGLNIIADKDVKGKVTASLGNITIKEALRQILDSQGYTMEEVNGVIRVKKKPPYTKVFKLKNISVIMGEKEEGTTSKKEYITDILKPFLSDKGKIVVDEYSNSIMVTDNEENLKMIEKFIKNIDVRSKQVLIEAKFVETTLSESKNLGIDWSVVATATGASRPHTFPFRKTGEKSYFPDVDTSSTSFSSKTGFPVTDESNYVFGTLDFTQFQAVLRALLTNSDTKIISNPRVATLNNQRAKVGITTEYPLPTYEINSDTGELTVSGYEYKEIGITLEVTPLITSDGYITMTVEPTVGSASETVTVTGTGFELPIITSKKATTKITVKDGETIVIGGLIEGNKSKTEKKIPLLGSIPLLGKLFTYSTGSDSNSELLIFVTPHILNPQGEEEKESKKIAQLYKEIEEAFKENKFEEAILKAEEIINIRPQEERAKELLQEAQEKLEKQKQKKKIESQLNQAINLYQGKKYQLAQQILNNILVRDSENKEAKKYLQLCSQELAKEKKLGLLWKEANSLYRKRNYESAEEKYSEILKFTPEDKTALKMSNICKEKIEKRRKYEVSSLLKKGERSFRRKRYKKAASYFQEVLKLEPGNKIAQHYLAEIRSQEISQEVKLGKPQIVSSQEEVSQLLKEAKTLFQEGKYAQASNVFKKILKLEPDREEAKVYLELCRKRIASLNIEEKQQLEEKGKKRKIMKSTVAEKGEVKEEQQPQEEISEKKIETVSEKKDVVELYHKALENYSNNNYKEAIELFEQILIKEPSNQKAYEYLEKCYQKLEEKEQEQQKEKVSNLIAEGKSYLRDGKYDKAFQSFYKILEIDPKNKEAKRYLSSLKRRVTLLESREAKGLSRELSRKEAQLVDAELKKAEIYFMEGDLEKAQEIAAKILESQESQKARDLLAKIDKIKSSQAQGAEREKVEINKKDARRIYLEGIKLYKKKEYQQALDKFKAVSVLDTRYNKKAKIYLAKCIEKLEILSRQKLIEKKYQLAIEYFNMALYERCIGLLREVVDLKPAYKEAQKYLNLAEKRLKILENLNDFEQISVNSKNEI